MPSSVIEAIRLGMWNFEPNEANETEFDSTDALPGSNRKLEILAERLRHGYPLWHPNDRRSYNERDED